MIMLQMTIQYLRDILFRGVPMGALRSTQWRRVRAEHLAKFPACAVCNGQKKIEVHHKQPFHEHPELELDPENLISLCESGDNGIVCHLAVGHLGNYRSINTSVDSDSKLVKERLRNRPK